MSDFSWQTEEEPGWDDGLSEKQEQQNSSGRNWRKIGLVMGGVLILSGLLFWQLRSRVGGAEGVRNEDLVAANNILVYAADRSDPSVLLNILPLENATWSGSQRALADHDLLLDRWPLGLERTTGEPIVKDIALSPDLQTADVTIEIPYQTKNKGLIETIHLQQTYQYIFRNEWQWSEPSADYWGTLGNEVYESRSFAAFYPSRDEALVKRLLDDLPQFFDGLCSVADRPSCGFALQILIHFEKEPSVWLDIADRIEENGSYIPRLSPSSFQPWAIYLPTPSLVGLPVDEAGYQALLRGYASHIFSAVLSEIYDDGCCPNDLTYGQFLEAELAEHGLGFWPPPAVNKEIKANTAVDRLPDRDIALLCPQNQGDRLELYRFNLTSGQLWPELAGRNIVRIRAAPNGLGIIVQEANVISEDEVQTRLIYWYDHTARILYEETLPETVFAAFGWQVHEEEQRMLIVLPDLDSRVTTFTLIDLADCAAGNCPKVVREMIGSPTWSPDGSQFLVKSGNILWWRQFNGDKIEQDPLGLGTAPFWIDQNTFAFVRTLEDRYQEIVKAGPTDEDFSVALTSERLRMLLPTDIRPDSLMIGYVGVNPVAPLSAPNRWTILTFEWLPTGNLGQAFVFSYDHRENALTYLLQSDQLHSFNVSPDGRWLAASLYDSTLDSWRIKMEPTEDGQDLTLLPWQAKNEDDPPSYDWTADSQWLLILHQGLLTLYSPGQTDSQMAPPPIPGCSQAEWMN